METVKYRGFRAEVFKKEGLWSYEIWDPEGEFFDMMDKISTREEAIHCAKAAMGCRETVNK